MKMNIPTARDINPVPENLDGQYAERHFLGRTVEEAVQLFHQNFLYYLFDLHHMGPVAFRYYFPAVIDYANSDSARHDCSVARALLGIFDFCRSARREFLPDVEKPLRDYFLSVLSRIDQMHCVLAADYRLERQVCRGLAMLDAVSSDSKGQ